MVEIDSRITSTTRTSRGISKVQGVRDIARTGDQYGENILGSLK